VKNFQCQPELLLFKLFDVHKIICNKANKCFSKDGVDIQVEQVPVLMVLYYKGPQSQQEIADTLLRDKSSVLRTIALLQQANYVQVQADLVDKRKKTIKLTENGQQLGEKIANEVSDIDNMMFSSLSTAEKLLLKELLVKCEQHIATLN